MPQGQAHTVWFPELKLFLKERWSPDLSIAYQFLLVSELNQLLDNIRAKYNIKPPMMWCPKCQKRTRSKFTPISITSMIYALKRFEICSEPEFKNLMKEWKGYSKKEGIDIYGNKENLIHEA
jgi:hypothetical protein